MTKNIYDKDNKQYRHEYYCDSCFKIISNGEINRSINGIEDNMFDLCFECVRRYDND